MIASPRHAEAVAWFDELSEDFSQWAELCYRIRTKDLRIAPLALNAVQLRIEAAEQEELRQHGRARLNILKGRQPGVTTYEQAKSLHLIWSKPHVDALTLAHSKDDTGKIFEITRRAIANFPLALLPRMGGAETYEVSFTGRDSHFWTGTAGAKATGRGLTLARVHCSEFAYYAEPRATLGAISPGLEGVPQSVIVLESTASAFDSEAHNFWRESMKGETGYRPLFFPWWECDKARYRRELEAPDELGKLTDHEAALVSRQGVTLEEIKWRREQVKHYGLGEFLKEYPEDDEGCWLVAGQPYFNTDSLLALAQKPAQPIAFVPFGETERRDWGEHPTKLPRDGEVIIYAEAELGEDLILGCDTAEGVGGDRSADVIRGKGANKDAWRLIEQHFDSRIEPTPYAGFLDRRCREREVFLVLEKNLHGTTVLRSLRDAGYPRHLIYRRAPLDEKNPESKSDRMGWYTGAGTYAQLLDAGRDLIAAALEGSVGAPSAEGIRDGFAVQREKDGGVHLTGRDVLVAEMLAWIGRTAPRRKPGWAGLY